MTKIEGFGAEFLNQYCIIRCYAAGVHIGKLSQIDGDKCILTETRNIHSWQGAKTVWDIAENWLYNANLSSVVPSSMFLGVVAIIPLSSSTIEKVLELPKTEIKF